MDLQEFLLEEVSQMQMPINGAITSYTQAPPTVHYLPNFVTAEEADLLWKQVTPLHAPHNSYGRVLLYI